MAALTLDLRCDHVDILSGIPVDGYGHHVDETGPHIPVEEEGVQLTHSLTQQPFLVYISKYHFVNFLLKFQSSL